MFKAIKNKAIAVALNQIKERFVNPNIDGIGVVKSLSYDQGKIQLTVILEGLEDHPLAIEASDIEIAPDGSTIKVGNFMSNLAFAHNALNKFAVREFEVPEGSARTGLLMAKKVMGL